MSRLLPCVLSVLFLSALLAVPAAAQHDHPHSHAGDRAIEFPDVPGLQTLVCDFHMHSVFSDGSVWPSIRVEEAERDGLDCIAITEHLEHLPHQADIPLPDHNRAYEIAVRAARRSDLIVLPGAEVTRGMPPGHANAIFIEDANALVVEDSVAAFRMAADQGAFVFWNHPMWERQRPDGIATLTDLHRQLIADGLLDGIEIVNDLTYSDKALQIALDHDLTLIGTSDVHGLVDWQYDVPEGGHRPVTLVFAEERSRAGIQAALEARRTVVWDDNTLIGRETHLMPLIEASVEVVAAAYEEDTSILRVEIENTSDAAFVLQNRSPFTFHRTADLVTLAPHTTTTLRVKTRERLEEASLDFAVLNALTAPATHPTLTLTFDTGNGGEED